MIKLLKESKDIKTCAPSPYGAYETEFDTDVEPVIDEHGQELTPVEAWLGGINLYVAGNRIDGRPYVGADFEIDDHGDAYESARRDVRSYEEGISLIRRIMQKLEAYPSYYSVDPYRLLGGFGFAF